jgi:hypothetical protein
MPQAVSRRHPTAATRVRSQVRSCGICGGQSGAGAGVLQVLQFPQPILIPPTVSHSSSSIIWGWYNRTTVADVSSGLTLTPPHGTKKKLNFFSNSGQCLTSAYSSQSKLSTHWNERWHSELSVTSETADSRLIFSISCKVRTFTLSDNKFRELIKCYIPHCWISLWSPSKYSPWEAMHRCHCLVHPSK